MTTPTATAMSLAKFRMSPPTPTLIRLRRLLLATAAGCVSGGGWYEPAPVKKLLWASSLLIPMNTSRALVSRHWAGNADIYQIFDHPQPYAAYHDITSGNNLYYPAETNYDMASGVGSPNVWNSLAMRRQLTTTLSQTWYFAEGYTGGSFTTYLTLANPNPSTATVTVTYLLGGGGKILDTYTVNPTSRLTVNVNSAVEPIRMSRWS